MKVTTAEKFLREKLESQIASFGDGMEEFHTRDIEHLLKCLDEKDKEIIEIKSICSEFMSKINFHAEEHFVQLLTLCMTVNNLSSEERLTYIRNEYRDIWNKINSTEKSK